MVLDLLRHVLVYAAIFAKAVIVLVVFPVVGHAAYTGLRLALSAVMPSVLAGAASWSEPLDMAVVAVTLLIAAMTAFGVCRRLWPTVTVRASLREAPRSLGQL